MLTSQASGTVWLRSDVLCFPRNEISLPRAVLGLNGGLGPAFQEGYSASGGTGDGSET